MRFTGRVGPQPIRLAPLPVVDRFHLAIRVHDLELAVRYRPGGRGKVQRLLASALRLGTHAIYIYSLPTVAAAVWATGQVSEATLPYLAYLFAVPLFVAGGMKLGVGLLGRRRLPRPPSAVSSP